MSDKLMDLLRKTDVGKTGTTLEDERSTVENRPEAFMLDFEFVNGNRFALPYSSLLSVKFNPSIGIIAKFGSRIVTITGINLNEVYSGVVQRRIGHLRASGRRPTNDNGDGQPIIFSIRQSKKKPAAKT